jgi:ribosomal protein S18 acetylase RimI-like enzyme
MEIVYRSCTIKDTEALAAIGARTFEEAYLKDAGKTLVDQYIADFYRPDIVLLEMQEPSYFFAAFCEDVMIGYMRLAIRKPGVVYIARMYVLQTWYGKGIAQELMSIAKQFTLEKDCGVLELSVWKINHRAIRFYEKCGFMVIGETRFKWNETREDEDWEMELKLNSSSNNPAKTININP